MNISILGAGVGGLSTAIALKKKGFDVTLVEKHSEVRNSGAGIVCWPNATFVLNELGMMKEIKQVAGKPTRMCRFNEKNEALGTLNIEKLNQKMGHDSYSILRKDLMSIFTNTAHKLGIKIEFNKEAVSIHSVSSDLTRVRFSDGSEINSDLIIGADGRMNSLTRKYVIGDNRPEYQGFINWIGVFHSSKTLFPEMNVKDYWGVGCRFGIVPISKSVAYWAGAVSSETIVTKDPGEYVNELLSTFHNWPDPIVKIIRQTPLNNIHKIYVHDHNPIKKWHKNNVLIIGDAAHAALPTSGQGACQALEDAWHLAELLDNGYENLSTLLETFTKTRLNKTENIILSARHFANSLFSTNLEACKQRDFKSVNTNYDLVIDGMAKGWASGLPI